MQHDSNTDNIDITKMKVPELRRELKLRGLTTQGNKIELLERLQEVLKVRAEETASATSVDELEEDLLNGDDDEHLDETSSCITDIDNIENLTTQKGQKRKSEELKTDIDKPKVPKKIVLKRNSSHTEENCQNKDDTLTDKLPDEKKVIKLTELGMKERLEMRAKKFGVTLNVEAKKAARAARFGTSVANGKLTSDAPKASVDVLKKRAERFGTSVSTVMSNIETKEKLEKRRQRFGSNGSIAQTKD